MSAVTYCQREIAKMKAAEGFDPRHIEAYMLLGHDRLSSLSARQFSSEVRLSVQCIREAGIGDAERLARSFGL